MMLLAAGFAASLLAASTTFAEVRLTIADGRVTVIAKDATLREILAEWARIGGTKIVNLERIPGGPTTLELTSVTEQEALDVLLRSVSGYIAAPRATPSATLSRFDRIVVMPTIVAPRAALAAPAAVIPQSEPAPVQFGAPQMADQADRGSTSGAVNREPAFNAFPQPQGIVPQGLSAPIVAAPAPSPTPAKFPMFSAGTAVPGRIVQPPAPTQAPPGYNPYPIQAPPSAVNPPSPPVPRGPGG